MMKPSRTLAKMAPYTLSRRIVGTLLPIARGVATRESPLPFATQRASRQPSSARSLDVVAQQSVQQYHRNMSSSSSSSSSPSSSSSSSSILEIERKFAPTAASMQQLSSNAGHPPFQSLIHHGTTSLEDAYYDTADEVLGNAGVWLRRRGDKWEAKVRVGGDFTNSAFEEITDVEAISVMLGRLVPGAALDPHVGLVGGGRVEEVARLVSERDKYLVDGKFTVVLDKTDFGHVVGEVELEREVSVTREEDISGGKGEDHKGAQVIAEMDQEIDNFMKRYVWAFPPGKPVGKLSAYFALKNKQQ